MMENQQSEWMQIGVSFNGVDFTTIQIPRVHYKDFLYAWEHGEIWETKQHIHSAKRSSIVCEKELLRLSEVKRIIIK